MDISSANAVYTLVIAGLYLTPQQLQGFATDDAFDTERVTIAQVMMGVDGKISGGIVPAIKRQTIALQADSPSNAIFDNWVQAQDPTLGGSLLSALGHISIPSIKAKFALAGGILSEYTPIPRARKVLEARSFVVNWQSILPSPI